MLSCEWQASGAALTKLPLIQIDNQFTCKWIQMAKPRAPLSPTVPSLLISLSHSLSHISWTVRQCLRLWYLERFSEDWDTNLSEYFDPKSSFGLIALLAESKEVWENYSRKSPPTGHMTLKGRAVEPHMLSVCLCVGVYVYLTWHFLSNYLSMYHTSSQY